ncbi:MAG: TIGR03663 family protein [Chloroflexi bacterium]|nr:TIGR03663 family protein [Chloroflexota bacterium]
MNADNTGFLDRPVFAKCKITWWHIAYGAIMVFIVFSRLFDLTSRAYCHDEAIHAWESWKLYTGQGYIHNPVYHSPFLYHLTAFIYWLFGDSDFTGRLGAAIGGIAITVMPLLMQRWLGKRGVLLSTLLLAISPVVMDRSRYIRHDQWAIFFNLLLLVGIMRYLSERKPRDLYLVAASLALSFTGKETSYITGFIFGLVLVGLLLWQWLHGQSRSLRSLKQYASFDLVVVLVGLVLPLASAFGDKLIGHDPLDYSTSRSLAISGVMLGVFMLAGMLIGVAWDWRKFLVCAGIFWGIYIAFFTTFFTNGQGFASGAVGSLGYWLSQHGQKRGNQPWYYYFIIIWMYEFLPFIGAITASIIYAVRGNPLERSLETASPVTAVVPSAPKQLARPNSPSVPFIPMLMAWTFISLPMYSWAGEKMPWLAMQFIVPMCILAGWGLGHIWDGVWQAIREKRGWILFISVPITIYAVYRLFAQPPSNGMSTAELSATMGWIAALLFSLGGAYVTARVLSHIAYKQARNTVAVVAFTILAVITLRFAWMASFTMADLPTAFIVYAQGTPDTRLVAHELEDMSRRLYGDLSMKVSYDDDSFWPMVWYLRNFTNTEIIVDSPSGPSDSAVVLVGPSNEDATKPFLGDRYYRRQYRLIWWPDESWYRDLTAQKIWNYIGTADGRDYISDIWWNHKWENLELTQWSLVNPFAMYVRKDVAAQLWDFGAETALEPAESSSDEYLTLWSSRTAAAAWDQLGLAAPRGMAVDKDGNVYIADSGNNRIVVTDADGKLLRTFGQGGSAPGDLNEPWGVAVAPSGDVYVADTWNYRIQVYSADGIFKFGWGGSGALTDINSSGDILYGPRDLVFDTEGNLLVTDTGNKRIVKYAADGTFIAAVGGEGSAIGQLREPVGLAVSSDGYLYVADTWNQRIQAFDNTLTQFNLWAVDAWLGSGINNKPYLAVDGQGNVYATDPSGNRVLEFNPSGQLLAVWGQAGNDLKSLSNPTGIALDSRGRLLVADSANNRILVYDVQAAGG